VCAAKEAAERCAARVRVGRGRGGGIGNKGGTLTPHLDSIIRRYLDGTPVRVLAEEFDVTTAAVRQAIKRRGHSLRSSAQEQAGRSRPGRRALTADQADEAARLYAAGAHSMADLAQVFGVSENGIRTTLQRAGVPIRPIGTRKKKTA
jgi:predicted DNA-binding protein YlxM (UPF0122 family)